jgi:two-component system, cell cycle response regulator
MFASASALLVDPAAARQDVLPAQSARVREAWAIYLSHPERAIALTVAELDREQANTPSTDRAWALLTRALAQCRSMERAPVADQIRADFSKAAGLFAELGDERGRRLTELSTAAVAMRQGDWPLALNGFEALIGHFDLNTLDPDNFYLCFGLSTAYVYQGRLEEGLRFGYAGLHLAQQLELLPEFASMALPLGVALMAAKDPEEAAGLLEAAVAIAERAESPMLLKTLRNNLAVALRRLGRLDEALVLVKQVLDEPAAMVGGQQFAHFNAAELYLKRGELPLATHHLELARNLLHSIGAQGLDMIKVHYIEGAIASRRQQVDKAVVAFSQVERMLPEVSALRFNDRAEFFDELADVLARSGRPAEAFVAQRKSSRQYQHSLAVVNRVRRFSIQVRHEISRINADLERESQERRKLQAMNLRLREQIDLTLNEAERLRDQASHDSLTGIFNRGYLDAALPSLLTLSQQSATPFAVVMVDLDHFKEVNDRHGHLMGDEVLRGFGQLARDMLRGSDIVGRYGGEEFCLALIGCGPDAAMQRMQTMLRKFAELSFEVDGAKLNGLSFSAGIAVYPEDGISVRNLALKADQRLLKAKAGGRGRVLVEESPAIA